MSTLKWKKLMEEGIRLFPRSFNVIDCVCMYRPIQGCGMCYATRACVWRMQLDLLNRVCTFGLKMPRWGEASLGQVVRFLRTHFGSSLSALDASEPWHVRIAWPTDQTLKVYCMTQRWPFHGFLHVDTEKNWPLPLSPVLSSLMSSVFF